MSKTAPICVMEGVMFFIPATTLRLVKLPLSKQIYKPMDALYSFFFFNHTSSKQVEIQLKDTYFCNNYKQR
jgi:hypothetical protein